MHEQAVRLGGDPGRVILTGGSAGAALAAATCLEAAIEAGPAAHPVPPVGLVLLYGLLDLRAALRGDQDPVGLHRLWARAYLGESFERRLDDPRVSPIASDVLHLLPPTYVACGDRDRLLAQSLAMIRALATSGVPVTGSVVAGSDHAFVKYAELREVERTEMARLAAWMHRRGDGGRQAAPPDEPGDS